MSGAEVSSENRWIRSVTTGLRESVYQKSLFSELIGPNLILHNIWIVEINSWAPGQEGQLVKPYVLLYVLYALYVVKKGIAQYA
jgi:hypothetical protein